MADRGSSSEPGPDVRGMSATAEPDLLWHYTTAEGLIGPGQGIADSLIDLFTEIPSIKHEAVEEERVEGRPASSPPPTRHR